MGGRVGLGLLGAAILSLCIPTGGAAGARRSALAAATTRGPAVSALSLATAPSNMASAYLQLADQGQNDLYVTPDLAFEQVHFFFSDSLENLEREYATRILAELLDELWTTLKAVEPASAGSGDDTENRRSMTAALIGVHHYLQTARCLLGRDKPGQGEPVAAEMALIADGAKVDLSPVMGYREDYTQYIPRGHYAKDEKLAAYFRTVTWLGRAGFYLEPNSAAGIDESLANRLSAGGVVLAALMARSPEATSRLDRLERLLNTWVGESDDQTIAQTIDLANRALANGQDDFRQAGLADLVSRTRALRTLFVQKGRRPRIASTFVSEGSSPPIAIRLLGQRFLTDSWILHSLTFDRVRDYLGNGSPASLSITPQGRKVRGTPRGLDVMAVLGSSLAKEELRAEGDADYDGYDKQAQELRRVVASTPVSSTFAGQYVAALAESFRGELQGSRCATNERLSLNGSLAAWALLRHDLAAYGKQSYTSVPRSLSAPHPTAHRPVVVAQAEPVFRALAQSVDTLFPALQEAGQAQLVTSGHRLRGALEVFARRSGGELDANGAAAFWDLIAEAAGLGSAVVAADVHTDVISGQVLQVGVGVPQAIVLETPPCGESAGRKYAGVIMTYYEFRRPMAERLDDKTWSVELKANPGKYSRSRFRWETGHE